MKMTSLQRLFIFASSLAVSASNSYGEHVSNNAVQATAPHEDLRGTSKPLRRRLKKQNKKQKRSYESCSMANPNGNICRMAVKFSNGEYDAIQVKELDGRLFRISDLLQSWREYVSVTKSKPQISFLTNSNDLLKDIKKCEKLLEKYEDEEDSDIDIGASLTPVEGFECTDFAKALIRRVLDKDAFPGNGNGNSPQLSFDDYDDDEYGYRNIQMPDEDEDADVDERNPRFSCDNVSATGSICKLSLEMEGKTYDLEAEQIRNREFNAAVNREGQELFNTNVKVDENGTIVLGNVLGGPFDENTCDEFIDSSAVVETKASSTLFVDSHGHHEKHECTAFGESLLYYLARRAVDDYGDGEDEGDGLLNNTGDGGSEDCSMASPNGGICQMITGVNNGELMVVLGMEEQDNRKFTVTATVTPSRSVEDRTILKRKVKVHKDGTIDIDGKSIGDDLYCGAVLDGYGDDDAAATQVLQQVDAFPCTLFAESIFRYLIDEELRVDDEDDPTSRVPNTTQPSILTLLSEPPSRSPVVAVSQKDAPDFTSSSSPIPTPTRVATGRPTSENTATPIAADGGATASPIAAPTGAPFLDTNTPTGTPTNTAIDADPTDVPTVPATDAPTGATTATVTDAPTSAPTNISTEAPTATPTGTPMGTPTKSRSEDDVPTSNPSSAATDGDQVGAPSRQSPTDQPTRTLTVAPTEMPTTDTPTSPPTSGPTTLPTALPTTSSPTSSPTATATQNPSLSPTRTPSVMPSAKPSFSPTRFPTTPPTVSPTVSPTSSPTSLPTTNSPTRTPTLLPTLSVAPSTLEPTNPGQRCARAAMDGGDCRLGLTLFGINVTVTMEELKGGNVFEMKAIVPGFADPWVAYAEVDEGDGTITVEETEFLQAQTYSCSSLIDAYVSGNVPYVPFTPLPSEEDSPTSTSTCTPFANALLSIMVGEGLQLYLTNFMN
jgi:hypothetical protein